MTSEYLLDKDNFQLTTLPIKLPDVWVFYKKMLASFWVAEEIDFSKDYDDFSKLSANAQKFIKMILAFFAASDSIVNINLAENFTQELQIREIVTTYQFQIMMENIHSETYSLQINNIIKDVDERHTILNAIENFECIENKTKWAMKWINNKSAPFVQRVIAFAIVEGIFFSGSFAAIFWLKDKGVMPGLTHSNELIARDEGLHTQFACLIKSKCSAQLDTDIVHNMFEEAVEIEKEFICESLSCALLGMNKKLMSQYIEFVADRLLLSLEYPKIWGTANPFDFCERQALEGKTNFFEGRSSSYQNPSVLNEGRNHNYVADDNF